MRDRVRLVGALGAISVLYVILGRLGLSFAYVNAPVTAVWPPAGIAVAALLVLGLRAWPAVAIGAFITNFLATDATLLSLAMAAGNTLESVVAVMLTVRYARGRHAFERGPDILKFTAFGAVLAPVVAATIGTVSLRASGFVPPADTAIVWLTWWVGDATGVVLFAPACILWTMPQPGRRGGRAEAVALTASLALVLYAVFGAPATVQQDLPLAVLMVPLLLWSAFRFDPRTTATLGVVLAAIALYRILAQLGPFSLGASSISLLVVQFVVALVSLLMLSVAAENRVRRRAESELRLLNDTLERRVAERTAELTLVHDRLLDAQAVAHVGSWEWDVATDSLWWSDELCRMFGLPRAPADYQAYLSRLHPDDRARTGAQVSAALATGQPFSFDHRIVRGDGAVRVMHAKGRVELDAARAPTRLLGTSLDITERTQAEESRAQLIREQAKLREAEETNRAKDAFLATLSHELRTPLNAALGWAHMLRESHRAGGRHDRAVDAIYRNLLLQSRLVADILDISQITKGELPLEREPVEMTAVFRSAMDMLHDGAAVRAVSVEFCSAGDAMVTGDARRLQQVAWNVLSNAVKFAATRGRVTVSIRANPDDVVCIVEDDGPGIAPAFLPHVFEQFRQADSSVTREHGGVGLGLAIAQEIVWMHGGSITAGNRPCGGAIFTLSLPRMGAAPQPVRQAPAAGAAGVDA